MYFFSNNLITVFPGCRESGFHSHPMLHIVAGRDDVQVSTKNHVYCAKTILIGANTVHKIAPKSHDSVVLLADRASTLALQMQQKYLHSQNVVLLESVWPQSQHRQEQGSVITHYILEQLELKNDAYVATDPRVQQLIDDVHNGDILQKSISEIARSVFLSESRLSHLFKEQTGMNLKNYLLLNRIKRAYQEVLSGKTITQAALNAGFSDSAHLAFAAKRYTGIAISELLKK